MKSKIRNANSTLSWWQRTRFGMFIHWGLDTATHHHCWKMYDQGTLVEDCHHAIKIIHEPTRDVIVGLPARSPDPIATVIKIKIRSKTKAESAAMREIGGEYPEAVLAGMVAN